jgi:hypothetical protein
MIRYRLDDLGWYQFEWLVQSLLKAELGLGVESWGGHGDYGRDAYASSRLNYPDRLVPSDGPFIFQVKFVENANAAGAKNEQALLVAIRKEAERIVQRHRVRRTDEIHHYTLITNAVLTPSLRQNLAQILSPVLPLTELHILGGSDVCDLLDKHTFLRRSFPQLLSIRDLDELISQAVNREVIEKSKAAVDIAKRVAEVFVPTRAYHWAWETLREYGFAVLEGPPEVGKTAIAWMISLGQLLNGWQIIVCDEPPEFFGSFREAEKQVFVCDDAFGRTEYDPARGHKWETQLERVLKRVDANHWFIWTTRKHIFDRALRDLDLQGAAHFRKAGRLVDVAQLGIEDKALMLYRHAKAAGLPEPTKQILREHASTVVYAPEFTPERIRRFVHERLPDLTKSFEEQRLSHGDLREQIAEAIRNPTDRMRKTFQKLPTGHKWVLISLFESGGRSQSQVVERIWRIRNSEQNQRFDIILDELREAFLTLTAGYLDWIHPSYRDLVIEELAADDTLRQRVLSSVTISGLKVAVSDTSGPRGEDKYPLIRSSSDWALLKEGCVRLIEKASPTLAADALKVVTSAAQSATEPSVRKELSEIIYSVCEATRTHWDASETVFTANQIVTFCQSSLLANQLPALPRFERSWATAEESVLRNLSECDKDGTVDCGSLHEWTQLALVIFQNDPRFLRHRKFPEKYQDAINRILAIADAEANSDYEYDSEEDYRSAATDCDLLIQVLDAMQQLSLVEPDVATSLSDQLQERSDEYTDRARHYDPGEPDYDYERSRSDEGFNLKEFFRDL